MRLAKALNRLRVCAGWSEPLLVAHTTLLEISCRGSFVFDNLHCLFVRSRVCVFACVPECVFVCVCVCVCARARACVCVFSMKIICSSYLRNPPLPAPPAPPPPAP